LVGSRVAQGVGAAMLSPAALSVVVTVFDGDERNRALGIWSALGGGGAALGVLVGGILTAGPGWSWVFYVNVPLGAAIIVALTVLLQVPSRGSGGRRLDIFGALCVTAATGTLIYALIGAGDRGWLSFGTLWLLVIATALYGVFFAWQRTTSAPLMDVRLLSRPSIASGILLILVATALMISVFFLGTFYFQRYQGYGALRTGMLFLPVALATMAGANATGRVIGRTGPRMPALAGLLTAAIGLAMPVVLSGPAVMVLGVAVAGAGAGAVFVVASATALGQVAPEEAGLASGLLSTFHEFGASLGAAVISSIAAASITGTSPSGLQRGFAVAAGAAAASSAIAFVALPPRKPQRSENESRETATREEQR
jgi:MFS family permease